MSMTRKERRKTKAAELPPVHVEIEGDRWTWWYVCEECHKSVNPQQEKCDGCGRRLIWE